MKFHYVTSAALPKEGTDMVANCGAVVGRATFAEILEPGSDRVIVTEIRDCRGCVKAGDALKAKHYFSRIVPGDEADKRYLGSREGEDV